MTFAAGGSSTWMVSRAPTDGIAAGSRRYQVEPLVALSSNFRIARSSRRFK